MFNCVGSLQHSRDSGKSKEEISGQNCRRKKFRAVAKEKKKFLIPKEITLFLEFEYASYLTYQVSIANFFSQMERH